MTSNEIILYDLANRLNPQKAWSLNPWKARASLNYKNLPYTTQWVEYPHLAPTFTGFGIPPNDPAVTAFAYSSPAVKFPDGTYVMDSRKIALALDKLQPEPSLHVAETGDVIDRAQKTVSGLLLGLGAVVIPRVPEVLLNPVSAEYFSQERAKRFGMPLPELAKSERAGRIWETAEPHIRELGRILGEHEGGPYVLGAEVSFADFVVGGLWAFVKRLDKGDLYERLMGSDERFGKHWEAVKRWFERED